MTFTQILTTSHTLSVTAMEEASRLGQHEADIDHLLLALTLTEQPAGQVLRAMGVTLHAARSALSELRADQLRSLGIATSEPAPGRITMQEGGEYTWTPRAVELMGRAAKHGGDATAVLRQLIAEPSGLIADLLERMGHSTEAVADRLDEVGTLSRHHPRKEPGTIVGTSEAFVPAPMAEVWALLADARRMPEWEPMTEDVDPPVGSPSPGSSWTTLGPRTSSNGKSLPAQTRRRTVELLIADEPAQIAWAFRFPDAPRSNSARLEIELSPAAGGTQLHLTWGWVRTRRRRPILGLVLRPLYRFFLWLQLQQISGGISRALRSPS